MADQYSRNILKVAIAQICKGLGWHAMQSTPCDILVDIMQRYIEKTGRMSSQYAAQFGRTYVNLDDLALTFQDMGLSLYEFENYIREVEPMPFVHDVPSFPLPKKNNLQHPPPGSRHCRERLASIPEYMPPLVGVKEDFTPVHDWRDNLFSSMSADTDSPELLSPTGQDGLEKRGEKRSPDYVDHSIKRFRLDSEGNLQEVVIGAGEDSNKRRVGKLPEAVTPPRRTSVMISEQKSAVTQALTMAGNGPKSKSPKQQKYGTQETKAPKMRLPISNASSKGPMKAQSKSPKHHLFSPNAPSKYPVKIKTPVNVGVIPQPNQAVEFKPAKGSKSQRASGGAISTLLSAALQIQDDEIKSTVVPVKKKDAAMSIYDFDDDIEGKGKENVAKKDVPGDGMKSPVTSGESKADPNSPRVYDEYEIVRTTYASDEDSKKDVKKKEKGKVRKKKEKVKQKDKKKPKVTLDEPLFLPDAKVKGKDNPVKVKVKVEVMPDLDSKPAQYSSFIPTKKVKPPKLDISKFVKKEPKEEMEITPKIVIKTLAKDRNVGKKINKSPISLKKTKKLDKWKKKKFKKDRYKVTLGFGMEQGSKTLTSKFGSPSKLSKGKEKPVKKLNIIKTNSSNPFQMKISSPSVETSKPAEPVVKEKPKKKKKIKEEKKVAKEETPTTSKSTTKDKEQKTAKSEPSSVSSVPKITLKMGGNTGDGKFVIKTIRPPSPISDKDSPPSSPISPPPPPVPKISIPVLPAKKSTSKPSTPKATKSTVKKPMKVKESNVFDQSLPPPTKPRQKSTPAAGKSASKTAKSNSVDSPVSPKGSTGKGRKSAEASTPGNKKTGAHKSSPKNSSVPQTATKSGSASKEKSSIGNKGTPSSKSSKTTGKGSGNPPGRPPGRPPGKSKVSESPKTEAKEPPAKKTVAEKPPKKEKAAPVAPPPPPPPAPAPAKADDLPMTIMTETLGSFVSETGEKIWICPACKRPDDGSPMVGCDDCDDWYHWPCVGITCEPSEDEWFCERCQALKLKPKGKKRGRKKKIL